MKRTSFLHLISFFLLVLFGACTNNNDDEVKISKATLNGQLLSKVDGTAIAEMKVNLIQLYFDDKEIIQTTTSDSTGNFYFEEQNAAGGRTIEIPNYRTAYQHEVWIDDELDRFFWAIGTGAFRKSNNALRKDITIELYPHCNFEIVINNEAPMAETDRIEFTLRNSRATEPQSVNLDEGVWAVSFEGLQENTILSGRTLAENILTIEYKVTSDSGTELFSETVECTPGELTQIEINY